MKIVEKDSRKISMEKIIGGAFMLSALCFTGLYGFFEFLRTAVFVVRIYSRRKFISRTVIKGRGKKLFRTNGEGRY